MTINAISSGLAGMQRQSQAMDRAAEKVARASLTDVTKAPETQEQAETIGAQESALVDGTVEMMVAKRMFTAALKVAQTANEGIMESLRIGNYEAAA
ncbi:MAG: hypothetical protein ABIZ91_08835 [Gemmatimonadaceae bacterium]